jgi:NAD(P)-dependent dehydrogenase (short-subunit alcohol dehydrogenase family)
MVNTVAAENVRLGITANAVLPGLIATERVRAMPAEIYEQLESTFLPSGRMGEAGEVAALVAYLATEEAGYVTGQAIGIDGGSWLNTLSLTREQRD